jgi:hypothetical protein
VNTDGWKAYNKIKWEELELEWKRNVHYNSNGLIKRIMIDSNLIGGLWGELKYLQKHLYHNITGFPLIKYFLLEA